jgi:hypothetical protein
MRRFVAVIGVLALALTIAPSGLDSTSLALDCCNGVMCPMHADKHEPPSCDMAGNPSAVLKPCPIQAASHYTALIVFVLSAPLILQSDSQSEPSTASLPSFFPDGERSIESPPPRFLLTA